MDEPVYTPEDILDEEIPFEIVPEAYSAALHCPTCGEPMVVVEATRPVAGGRFVFPYLIYECRSEGRRYFNPEQASRFSAILRLEKLIAEKGQQIEGDVLFDGHDFFIRLPLAKELFQPRPAAAVS
jgi:hypothetical protein